MHARQWFESGGLAAILLIAGCIVRAVVNIRHNRRADAAEMHDLREADLDRTRLDFADAGRGEDLVAASTQAMPADPAGLGQPREDQLDDEWADQLAAMNAEHLNLIDHLHPAEPCQEWCCWERRLEADRAAWLELVRADVTVVAEWIVAGTPGRWVPSAAGWPSDDWRGEMIPA